MEVPNDFLNRGLSQMLKIPHGYLVLPIIGSVIIKEALPNTFRNHCIAIIQASRYFNVKCNVKGRIIPFNVFVIRAT